MSPWAKMSSEERTRALADGIVPCDYPGQVAGDWPELLAVVEALVKPFREKQKRQSLRDRWWQYGEKRPGLRRTIAGMEHVIVLTRISPHISFCRVPNRYIYQNMTHVFALQKYSEFALLQSRAHEFWARFFSATLEDRVSYSLTDAFRTFPQIGLGDEQGDNIGHAYHDHRTTLMIARNEGMTKTYNRFHDRNERREDIAHLRDLHTEMDRAVLRAYGWNDLAERAAPIFLDETNEDDQTYQGRLFWPSDFRDEVFARLLALNAERHAEEVRRGVAPGTRSQRRDVEEDYEE